MKKEKEEEHTLLKEKHDLPGNINTDNKSEKSNNTSNETNLSDDTYHIFLHFTNIKHKSVTRSY